LCDNNHNFVSPSIYFISPFSGYPRNFAAAVRAKKTTAGPTRGDKSLTTCTTVSTQSTDRRTDGQTDINTKIIYQALHAMLMHNKH